MKCPRCQHEGPLHARFCLECGTRLALSCSKCRAELPPDAKFCLECGESVTHPTAASSRFASPESYTPRHLAERVLTSKAALEGERKQVTVLIADLKGSMKLLADRDPEEARKILDPVLERMMEAVHRYEGTVNQVMGDGIMALFGAPLAHEDHAVRACYAALRMQESVKKYAAEVRRSHAAVVKMRVGLNSGEVVVRAIGSDLHMDYTAVGQTTHLAARMEQIADPGAIVITPETLALAEGYVEVKSLGPVPVTGLTDAVEIYEVTGAGLARTRFQAAARRGLTRFVGRDAELEQLRRAQQLAGNGHGQVAAIVGEAGVGKSRLVYEFTHSHRMQGWLTLESASVSYGAATSYLPVIDLLKGYFKIQDHADLREIREKVTGKLLTLDESLKPTLPALLALLDVPVDEASWQTLDPGQRRHRTLDAVKRLLLREAREQPLLVILEDLHWIDGETQALLDSLIESLGSARLLLLMSYRPGYQHAWGSKTHYSQIRLDALLAESAGELLDAILGEDPGLAPLKQLLIKRGNPFFLEETVRNLVETKVLAGERGRYRLTQPVHTIQVPPTVQAMLAARIDRLPPEDKRLLQTSSVIGKDVPFALLQAIAELSDEALRGGLDHLQAAEFLYETGLYPDLEYSFKHALTHEVTYGGLLQERRRDLHARIVDAIETLQRDRLGEQIERLAHHAFLGHVWGKAAVYLRQAGAKAAARSAHQEAVACFERALASLEHLPKTRDTIEQAIDLRLALKVSLTPLGEPWRMLDSLRETEVLAETLGDQGRLGRVCAYMSDYSRLVGDHERAVEVGHRALTIAQATGDVALAVMTNTYLGLVHYARGEYRRATEFFRKNVDSLVGERRRERLEMPQLPSVHSRAWLACGLAELGDFTEGIATAKEGVLIAESVDHPVSLTAAYFGAGSLYLRMGDLLTAIAALERGLEICRQWNLQLWFPSIAAALGCGYALSARTPEALPLLEQAVERSSSMNRMGLHSIRVAALGEAYLLAGRLDDAISLANQALALSRRNHERGNEAWALRLLGEIASNSTADAAIADNHYHEALALAGELGMRPLIAHCRLGLGRLHRRAGNGPIADEHFAAAIALFSAMGIQLWATNSASEPRRSS